MESKAQVVMCVVCRVHAKHIGHSLFGDDAYGGAAGSAVSALGRGKSLRYAFAHILFVFQLELKNQDHRIVKLESYGHNDISTSFVTVAYHVRLVLRYVLHRVWQQRLHRIVHCCLQHCCERCGSVQCVQVHHALTGSTVRAGISAVVHMPYGTCHVVHAMWYNYIALRCTLSVSREASNWCLYLVPPFLPSSPSHRMLSSATVCFVLMCLGSSLPTCCHSSV